MEIRVVPGSPITGAVNYVDELQTKASFYSNYTMTLASGGGLGRERENIFLLLWYG